MKQKDFPKVIVVTVTYNAEKYLEATVKSVIEQDYPNIEYIIIDGKSSDGTVDIIKKYENYLAYWVSEPDRGIYDAMNKGIEVATGEWINFMNAGDSFVSSDTISKVVENIDVDDEFLYGDIYRVGELNSRYICSKTFSDVFNGMPCCHQALFVKTDLIKQYKFDLTYKVASDYDLVLKCFRNGHRFKTLDFAIANFIAGGVSDKQVLLGRIENMNIQSKYFLDAYDIYRLPSYQMIKMQEPNQNYFFSMLLNQINKQINEIKRKKQKIAVYGYGVFAKFIACELEENIVIFFDRDAQKISHEKVALPEKIGQYKFDYILISVLGREEEISQELQVKWDMPVEKIVVLNLEYSEFLD